MLVQGWHHLFSDLRKGFSVSVPDSYFKVQLYYEDAVCMATEGFSRVLCQQ